jgi:glutathione S-transferase
MEGIMKLYWLPLSPNNFPVSAVADYLGIPLERIPLDISKGENRTPEYLKLNPNGKTPTLTDGNFSLWESNAIMIYLASKKSGNDLWPTDELKRIDITRWMLWQQAHWQQACGTVLWEKLVKKILNQGDPDPSEIKKGEEGIKRFGAVLNQCLEGKSYLVNNRLSLADFSVAAPLPYAEFCQFPLEGLPHLKKWYGQIESLEAWQKNLPKPPSM